MEGWGTGQAWLVSSPLLNTTKRIWHLIELVQQNLTLYIGTFDISVILHHLTSMATWNCSCSFLSCSASARHPGIVKEAISIASVFWIHRITWPGQLWAWEHDLGQESWQSLNISDSLSLPGWRPSERWRAERTALTWSAGWSPGPPCPLPAPEKIGIVMMMVVMVMLVMMVVMMVMVLFVYS